MAGRNGGPLRAIKAAHYSWKGLRAAFQHEEAFRQELFLALLLIPLTFFLPVSANERIFMISATILVLIVELLNSAVEAVVDRVGMEDHELAGRAKDIGSAAVMLTLLLCGFIWLGILFF